MRSDDEEARTLFQPLTCTATQATVTAERTFLARLQEGVRCRSPPGPLLLTAGSACGDDQRYRWLYAA